MRDNKKRCGMTVHQREVQEDASNSKRGLKLGKQCVEYTFKDPVGRRKKQMQPPVDYRGKAYLAIPSPKDPFSLFLWYEQKQDSDPTRVCVDVTVDGKRSPGWVLSSGRKNGIAIDHVMFRGERLPFTCSALKTDGDPEARNHIAGVIEAKFWRGFIRSISISIAFLLSLSLFVCL